MVGTHLGCPLYCRTGDDTWLTATLPEPPDLALAKKLEPHHSHMRSPRLVTENRVQPGRGEANRG